MKKIFYFLIVTLCCCAAFTQEDSKDPFRKGAFPGFHRIYSWEEFANKFDKIDGNLITIYGWLEVVKVPTQTDFDLVIKVYKNLDSKRVGFVQDALVLKLTAKTLNAYKNGAIDEWLALDGKAAYVTGNFKFNVEEFDDGIKGIINEPIRITTPAKLLQTNDNFGPIMTKDAIWK